MSSHQKLTRKKVGFYNREFAKKQLQDLVYKIFWLYGDVKASQIVDRLHGIGFFYATLTGYSMGLDDFKLLENGLEVRARLKKKGFFVTSAEI